MSVLIKRKHLNYFNCLTIKEFIIKVHHLTHLLPSSAHFLSMFPIFRRGQRGESLDKGKNATQRFKRLRPEIRSLNVEI